MQIPIIPYRGKIKPYGSIPRINMQHPLARGLVFYGYDASGYLVDLVGSSRPSLLNTPAPPALMSPFGSGLKYTSGQGSYIFPATNRVDSIFAAKFYSIATAWYITALPSVTLTCPFGVNQGASVANTALLWDSTATTDMAFSVNNSRPAGTGTNSVSAFHTFVGTNTAASAQQTYFDGKPLTTTATATAVASTVGQPMFNSLAPATANASNGVNGWIFYGAVWNRTLTANEAFILHNDPYCFLIYPQDEIFATLQGHFPAFRQPWTTTGRKINIIGDR